MHRLLTAATQVALVTAVLALTVLVSESAMASTLVANVTGSDAAAPSLQLEADVPELWPGHRTTLDVRVTSTSTTDTLKITALQARVGDAAPGCLAGNVVVVDYALPADGPAYEVAAGGTVTVPLAITMLNTDTNQDACKGVSFPIAFTAHAVAAG